ncbi:hypothetical protein EIK77_004803 [Talaromyces pinophilus]|nr:hypothetical protein EIK77_004803 [Talaromyces pinophilus]PCH00613.1 Hypothetical protein PENO1_047350 [Penicillium occitanis (nom. inval.)]PCH01379.1 hypothetical protein PENOC_048650 [Penicillium occitanis (nom. inval.)]
MPEKRKTDPELRDGDYDLHTKRARQQISYDDLDDSSNTPPVVQAESTGNEPEDDVAGASGNEGEGKNLGHGSKDKTSNKQNNRQRHNQQPRVDPVYGQRSAFPGLDDVGSDELLYGPPEDGLEYLRLVRSEANSLPALFVAPKPKVAEKERQTTEEGLDQLATTKVETEQVQPETGYVLIDGVVIATSTTKEPTELDVEEKRDAQSSYYNLLKHRFILLRTTLRCSPPANTITGLDESHPITLPFHVKAARAAWTQLLYTAEPQMVQLACMDMESVLGVLRLLGDVMSKCVKDNDADQLRRIGAWAWGLLGRCRDVGELGSEEVGELRVFGRKALYLLKKMDRIKTLSAEGVDVVESDLEDKEFSDEEDEITTIVESMESAEGQEIDELEAAKLRLQSRFLEEEMAEDEAERRRNTSSPLEAAMDDEPETTPIAENTTEKPLSSVAVSGEEQSRILLDMIITIVGEFYGQKDLLQERDVWN